MLSREDQVALIGIARDAIAGRAPAPPPPALEQPGAAFVTLYVGGELRGCIGHLQATQPLWRSVAEMAVAAATRDDRFASIHPDEGNALEIEISVLSPFRKIAGPADIAIGVDGLYMKSPAASGILLPKVAVEHGFDAETFFDQTCLKAGLPRDAWRRGLVEMWAFSAEVIR